MSHNKPTIPMSRICGSMIS